MGWQMRKLYKDETILVNSNSSLLFKNSASQKDSIAGCPLALNVTNQVSIHDITYGCPSSARSKL